MDDPAKLKKEVVLEKTKLMSAEKLIAQRERELSTLDQEIDALNLSLEKKLARGKATALEEFRTSSLSGLQRDLDFLRSSLSKYKSSFSEKLANLSLDSFLEEERKGSNLRALEKLLESAIVRIRQKLGDSVVDDVLRSDTKMHIDPSPENLKKVEDYFKKRLSTLKKSSKVSAVDRDFIEKSINSAMLYLEENGSKRHAMIVGSLATLVSLPLLAPIYIPYVLYNSFKDLNDIKSYRDMLNDYLLIQSNLEYLTIMEENRARLKYNAELQALLDSYEEEVSTLNKQVEDKKEELDYRKSNIDRDFVFDDSEILSEHNSRLDFLENKRVSLVSEIDTYKDNLLALSQSIEKKNEAISNIFVSKKESFFEPKCDQYKLPSEIIIDITDSTITAFPYKPQASLVFGDEFDDLMDFSSLVMYQFKGYFHPEAYLMEVWDTRYLGSYHSTFSGKSERVTLVDTMEDVNKSITALHKLCKSRREYLSSEDFKDLYDYNMLMLENDSLIESYRFIHVISADKSLYSNPDFISLLSIGSKYGIYIFVFSVSEDVSSDYLEILRYTGNNYLVETDKVTRLAENVALDFINSKV